MTLDEQIAGYAKRLAVGWEKLRTLELEGKWNEKMWQYWYSLNESYKKLCKLREVMG